MKTEQSKLIACILPKGTARTVMLALKSEYGIITGNRNFARGVGKLTPRTYYGIGEQTEKEHFTVVVPEEQADEIFTFIYHTANIDRPHGGLMYMHALQRSLSYTLPDLPQEESTS